MCNCLHEHSKPIKKEGTGYKVFTKVNGKIFKMTEEYFKDNDELYENTWIEWDTKKAFPWEDGFCFCLTFKNIFKVYKMYVDPFNKRFIIKKIKYEQGLGKHKNFEIQMALCKKYMILDEVFPPTNMFRYIKLIFIDMIKKDKL
jgi:hypothetical protein